MADDWTMTWSALIARIGSDLTDGAVTWGADPIERSSARVQRRHRCETVEGCVTVSRDGCT